MRRLSFVGCAVAVCAVSGLAQDPTLQVRVREEVGGVLQVLTSRVQDSTLSEAFVGPVVKGHPVSATESRKTLQILANGVRIETSDSNRLFRDTEGRTRVEGKSTVRIVDPVAGFQAVLDPVNKVVSQIFVGAQGGGRGVVIAGITIVNANVAGQGRGRGGGTVTPTVNANGARSDETTEKLTPQTVNGVLAEGTRTTLTIPKGQIGNDRDIKVVTERWYSNDLQMLIKSTNSDPRFGDTTYELTNIVTTQQEPGLFQIPADYTSTPGGKLFVMPQLNGAPLPAPNGAPGGRGGRGGGRGGN